MRSRNLIFIVGLVVMSAFSLTFVGCSDDDPAPTQISGGDDVVDTIASPQFSTVKEQVEDFVEDTRGLVNDGLSMALASVDELDDIVFGPAPPDSSKQSDNWLIYFFMQAGAQIYGLDSIRFLNNGVPRGDVVGADQILFKHYWCKNVNDTTVSHATLDIHSDLDLTGIDGTTATIDGFHNVVIASKYVSNDSTVWWDFDIQATITDFTVNKSGSYWNYGCPCSGSMSVTVDASYKKDSAAVANTSWEFDLTFTNGLMEAEVTLDTDTCSYSTQVCTVQ